MINHIKYGIFKPCTFIGYTIHFFVPTSDALQHPHWHSTMQDDYATLCAKENLDSDYFTSRDSIHRLQMGFQKISTMLMEHYNDTKPDS